MNDSLSFLMNTLLIDRRNRSGNGFKGDACLTFFNGKRAILVGESQEQILQGTLKQRHGWTVPIGQRATATNCYTKSLYGFLQNEC